MNDPNRNIFLRLGSFRLGVFRLGIVTAGLLAASVCLPAAAMAGSERGQLNLLALLGGLTTVLAIGLYLQSRRRRPI